MKTFILALALMVHLLHAGSLTLLRQENMQIPVAGYRTVRFVLQEYQSNDASLRGDITVSPDTASIELILLHIDDYMRWRNDTGTVDTLCYKSKSTGFFEMEVPGLGSYALVVSNRGNYCPVSVTIDMNATFSGSGKSGDPLPSAFRIAVAMIMVATAIIAVGSVLSKHFARRGHIT